VADEFSPAAASVAASASPSDPPHRGRPFESLRTRAAFDRVFQEGQRVRCGPFTLVIRPEPGVYRVGFKIGRKVGKAVRRNKLRRRFRAGFEAWIPGPGKGAEVVVLASPAATRQRGHQLRSRLDRAMRKAGFRPRVGNLEEE
jgi:ribonuclease P protein component